MKNNMLFAALFVAASLLLGISCSDQDDQATSPAPEIVTLSISSGESLVVEGQDLTQEITITASGASDKNILLLLTPEHAAEGEVTFASNHLLIAAGETSVKTLVTFPVKGFPAGSPEKQIGIRLSTPTAHATVGRDHTATFSVRGVNGRDLLKVAVTTPDGSSFDTTSAPGVAKILFTLDAPLDFDLPLTIQYAEGCDLDVQSDSKWDPFPLFIPKGQRSVTQTITVRRGAAGVMKLQIKTEPGDQVKLSEDKIDFTFLKYEASILANEGLYVRVSKTSSATRRFTVSLTNPAIRPVEVALQLGGDPINGASMDRDRITFAVGEHSKEVVITFSNEVFNSKDVQETVVVQLSSTDVPITGGRGQIAYLVAGEKSESEKEQLALEFKTEGTSAYPGDNHRMDLPYNNSGDGAPANRYDFWIGAKQAVAQSTALVMEVQVAGFNPEDYYCPDISSGGDYVLKPRTDSDGNATLDNWLFTIRFTESAKGKSGKIVFTSNDATISSGEIIVTVK